MMGILGWVMNIVALVCWVLVLVKLFQDKEKNGVIHGILGIVTCGLWAFIWGWIQAGRLNLTKVMIAWSLAIILSFVLGGAAVFSAITSGGGTELTPR